MLRLLRRYFNKGVSKADDGEYKAAIEDFSKAIEINPKYLEAYYNMGTSSYLPV